MRIVYEYSHLGGAEILHVRYPDCEREVYEIIADVVAPRTKISAENLIDIKKAGQNANRQSSIIDPQSE